MALLMLHSMRDCAEGRLPMGRHATWGQGRHGQVIRPAAVQTGGDVMRQMQRAHWPCVPQPHLPVACLGTSGLTVFVLQLLQT